jgi:hypothetical protein
MGLYQQFWAFRKRYVTVIQRLLRDPNARCNPWGQHEVPRSSNPYTTTGASQAVGGNDRDLLSATTPASPQQHFPIR